jgi:hypothetical protein
LSGGDKEFSCKKISRGNELVVGDYYACITIGTIIE